VCWNKKNQRWQTAINTQGKCVSQTNSDPSLLCIPQSASRVAAAVGSVMLWSSGGDLQMTGISSSTGTDRCNTRTSSTCSLAEQRKSL
jgi:hypothetical protein